MNENLPSIVITLVLGGLAAYFYLRRILARQWTGELTLPNGHAYPYAMGDFMRLYRTGGGQFHGISIVLPKEMPHIYLDSLRGGGRHARFVIDPSQLVELEGNFSRDFHVFVPRKHEAIALSILSPDVMVTLQKHATAFDIEIYGDQVRIISNKQVSHNKGLQDALLVVALKVMGEIDHRLVSWSRSGSLAAREQDLLMYPGAGVRIYGRYVTYWAIGWTLYWFFACAGLSVAAIAVLIDPKQPRKLGIFLL